MKKKKRNPEEVVISYRDADVVFTGRFKEAVFSKNIIKFYFDEGFTGTIQEWLDPANEYNSNNYGYRGPDFSSDVELLTAGCSVTYGIGVPEEGTWPAILSEQTGLSYAKLAKPGASVEWIVNQLFGYFHEIGNPKNLVVMFPDMFRGEAVINSAINISRYTEMSDFLNQALDLDHKKGIISYSTIFPDEKIIPRLVKRPFAIEDTTVPEAGIYRAIKSVRMLETYCKAAGINFIWSSWSGDFSELMRDLPEEYAFDFYIPLAESQGWVNHFRDIPVTEEDPEGIMNRKLYHTETDRANPKCEAKFPDRSNCTCYIDCHQEYLEMYPDSFYLGTDRKIRGNGNAHMGVHRHVHAANDFFKNLK